MPTTGTWRITAPVEDKLAGDFSDDGGTSSIMFSSPTGGLGTLVYHFPAEPALFLDSDTAATHHDDLPSGWTPDSAWCYNPGMAIDPFDGHFDNCHIDFPALVISSDLAFNIANPSIGMIDSGTRGGIAGEFAIPFPEELPSSMTLLALLSIFGSSAQHVCKQYPEPDGSGIRNVTSRVVVSGTYTIIGTWWTKTDDTGTHYMNSPTDPGDPWIPADAPPVPNTTHVEPIHGTIDGGTAVVITGTGFGEGATVFFDAGPATSVTVVNATQITATTPAGPGAPDGDGGPIFVRVRNIDGAIG